MSRSTLLAWSVWMTGPGVVVRVTEPSFVTWNGTDGSMSSPLRDVASTAVWLTCYPSIEIICRDRGGEYAEAARVGAPQAVQVADRFHLSQNLHEALDQAIRRRSPTIHQLLSPTQPVLLGADLPLKRDDAAKVATQKRRRARYERVKVLHEQGYSLAQIAASLGMKQETVQTYLMEPPRPPVYKHRHGKLTRYKPFIHRRFFQEGCRNSLQIFGKCSNRDILAGPRWSSTL
jgi:hypothetical protein